MESHRTMWWTVMVVVVGRYNCYSASLDEQRIGGALRFEL